MKSTTTLRTVPTRPASVRPLLCASVFILTILPALATAQLPSGESVIAMALESYGGEKALRAVKTVKIVGVMKVDDQQRNLVGCYERGGRFSEVVEDGSLVFDGQVAWMGRARRAPEILEGAVKVLMADINWRWRLCPLLDWKQRYTMAENLGEKKVGYYQCYEIRLSPKVERYGSGEDILLVKPEHHYIDKDTGVHVRMKQAFEVRDRAATVTRDFRRFKTIGGVNLANELSFRMERAGEKPDAWSLVLSTVEINKALPKGVFARPESVKTQMAGGSTAVRPPSPVKPPTGGTGVGDPPQPGGPTAVVKQLVQAVSDVRPRDIWTLLPRSYQRDLEGLVHGAAKKMDAEVWEKGFAMGRKLLGVLKSKKRFLRANPLLTRDISAESWDDIIDLLGTVLGSELKSLSKVRSLSAADFLSGTGMKIAKKLKSIMVREDEEFRSNMRKFGTVRGKLLKSGDTEAELEMSVEGEEPDSATFVKVEGRWVPEELVRDWPPFIAAAREEMAVFELDEDQKAQALTVIATLRGVLDQISEAATQEAFDKAVEGAMKMMEGM